MQQVINSTNTENKGVWNKPINIFLAEDIDDEVFDDQDDDENVDISSDWDWNIELDDEYPGIPY